MQSEHVPVVAEERDCLVVILLPPIGDIVRQ